MAGYTRQSTALIASGLAVSSSAFNSEFNAIQTAFAGTGGHAHDGTTGSGPQIVLTTSVTGILPVANGGTGVTASTGTGNNVLSAAPTFSGLVQFAGSTQVSAAGLVGIGMTPSNVLDITQTQNASSVVSLLNASTGASAALGFQANNGTSLGQFTQFGSGYTAAGLARPNGTLVGANGAGGLTIGTFAAQPIYFGINNAQIAEFDTSGNLLVGTTAVAGSQSGVVVNRTSGFSGLGLQSSGAYAGSVGIDITSGATITGSPAGSMAIRSGSTLLFSASGTGAEQMRLDTSGRLGIGVTPNANWYATGWSVAQFGSQAALAGSGNSTYLGNNWYWDGTSDRYLTGGQVSRYVQNVGTHQFQFAASGSAGAAIGWTTAMTLSSTGLMSVPVGLNIGGTGTANAAITYAYNGINTNGQATYINSPDGAAGGQLWVAQSSVSARAGGSGGVNLASGATSWASLSDEREKNLGAPITGALSAFATLRTVHGNYKTDAVGVGRLFLIAQDIQAVFPEVVDVLPDEQKTLSARYTDLVPALVAGINELSAAFAAQSAEITELKERVAALARGAVPDGTITAIAVAKNDLTLGQYIDSVGTVEMIGDDGRPLINVKCS